VLSPKINPNGECLAVAKVLENIYMNNVIKVQLDTLDLNKEEIANVRFLLLYKILILMFMREVILLNFIKDIRIVLSLTK
jgi:hypothetical protein